MQEVLNTLQFYGPGQGLSIALGRFDGVHVGHQALIGHAVTVAGERGLVPSCFSFREESYQARAINNCLTTDAEKAGLIAGLGVEILLHPAFEPPLIDLTAERFVNDLLIDQWNARHIAVGYDFHFGKDRGGDAAMLQRLGSERGVSVHVLDPVMVNDEIVKSTAIRGYIRDGNISHANQLLGRPYFMSAGQVSGRHVGMSLGFPTLNFEWPKLKVKPRLGVYAVRVKSAIFSEDSVADAVAGFGVRPTVEDRKDPVLEVNVIQPEKLSRSLVELDLSRRVFTIEFFSFLRGEQKFDSLDKLKEQIGKDRDKAREILSMLQ